MAFALAGGVIVAQGLPFSAEPTVARPGSPHRATLEVVTGTARIVDGDTIDIAGRRVRLEGIDAPEAAQTCPGRYAGGLLGPWRCGIAATSALSRLIGSSKATCEVHETDKYDRLIATCFAGGRNLNREMVLRGHAWAFVKYSNSYAAEERQAKTGKTGIWASAQEPQPAWDFRARRWANAEEVAPEGCVIKGNISKRGERIYHTPWSPWYQKVRVSAPDGERWYCDEAEAMAAGFRPAVGR